MHCKSSVLARLLILGPYIQEFQIQQVWKSGRISSEVKTQNSCFRTLALEQFKAHMRKNDPGILFKCKFFLCNSWMEPESPPFQQTPDMHMLFTFRVARLREFREMCAPPRSLLELSQAVENKFTFQWCCILESSEELKTVLIFCPKDFYLIGLIMAWAEEFLKTP